MNMILKYPLDLTELQVIEMPTAAQFLCLQLQRNVPTLWVVGDLEHLEYKHFQIFPTGAVVPQPFNYLGTFQIGPTVWHVCEIFK